MTDKILSIDVPWVENVPGHIKSKYLRFVLIDGDMNAAGLPEDDGDTLFITTSWAAWCSSLKEQRHCLHYEAGLADWPERGAPVNSFVDQIADSLCPQSGDPTFFMGASILDSLQGDTVNVGNVFLRLEASLNFFIDTYEPAEILYYNMSFETRSLPSLYIARAVEVISSQHQLSFKDISNLDEAQQNKIPQKNSSFASTSKYSIRKTSIQIYVHCISAISWARKKLVPHKDNVLIQPTGAMIKPLLESYNNQNIAPVLFARQTPKSFSIALRCALKGVQLVESPDCRETLQSAKIAQGIIKKLDHGWASEEGNVSSLAAFMRYYFRKHFIESGKCQDVVEQIIAFDAFLENHRIRRFVCSGFLNPEAMIFLQLARQRNIPSDYILHGLRVNFVKYPQLRKRDSQPHLIPRLLAWGPQNADWLSGLKSETDVIYTGYPGMPAAHVKNKPTGNETLKALVLPFEPDRDNIIGLHSHSFAALAEIVNVLLSNDYEVIVKVHPGFKRETYAIIMELFQLDCEVTQKGDFLNFAEDADIIVGPMNTSAMIQAIAIGKPYYPCAIPPTIDDASYILNHQPSTCGENFEKALRENRCLDNQKVLTYFCGTDSPTEILDKFWQAMPIKSLESSVPQKSGPLASS